ncbi:hypothetical protein [Sediminibacterium sp.]|uniref:hypothetical protein n=1 Tax=Sediminibacterium sp. TaxID=1917865 RepID=UPI0027359B67|nr:hypothetical protein [Sediminibacterium sp.]MDP3394241.1 hypothetical protein [Sediminibacterium sp.]MDP3567069.1 hypothetical protein [Sediminibacterium sp.]
MTNQYIINAGIQIVPINIVDPSYAIINQAINHIRQSGLEIPCNNVTFNCINAII